MKALVCDRVDIGSEDRPTYFDPKKLPFNDQIDVGVRTFVQSRPSVKRKAEVAQAKANEEATKRIECIKSAILMQIDKSMDPEKNRELKRKNKKALAATLVIARQFDDVLGDILKHQEFSGYSINRYEENKDALLAFPSLPIIVRFEKTFV